MRAIKLKHFGGPEVLELSEAPSPLPGPGQIAVKVEAAGINFADTLMRENRYAMAMSLPTILGSEVAGVVSGLGKGVSSPEVGTRIAAPLFAAGVYSGGYAEEVVIDARYAVPLPDGLSSDVAVALMVQGLTALYLIRQAPPTGKKVLVNAGAGGVGSLLIQLARRAGATQILATASTEAKRTFTRTLGADVAIDYTQEGWTTVARDATGDEGIDVVYESVGGDICIDSLSALGPLGQMVIYGAQNANGLNLDAAKIGKLIFGNQSVLGFALVPLLSPEPMRESMVELFDLVLAGELEVVIGGRFPLNEAAQAHSVMAERGTVGKLVLVP
jgi:NADPH2:quinone reductase